jgi:large subunit ribosomal protein L21
MYAIVKTGGKQYRVEEGQSLLVERLRVDDGGKAALTPLLYVDGDNVLDGEDLAKVSVEARVVGHERGPKLRVVKFKPKRGYKRRTGHRQELTRIEVTSIKLGSRRGSGSSRQAPKPVAAEGAEATAAEATAAESAKSEAAPVAEKPARTRTRKPAGESGAKAPARRRAKPPEEKPKPEEDDGA